MKKLIIIIVVAASACIAGTGCKKFVDIGQPKNQLISAEVFADSTDASATLVGIYIASMNNSMGINSGGLTLYPGLSADELAPTGTSPSIVSFTRTIYLPTIVLIMAFGSPATTTSMQQMPALKELTQAPVSLLPQGSGFRLKLNSSGDTSISAC